MGKSRGGRPTNVTIADDDATIIRKALKATVRYYGIRLQDLGPESWIAHAMRTKASMSVETALLFLAYITRPNPKLVGKKRPQGSTTKEAFERFLELGLGEENAPRELPAALMDDAAAQYYAWSSMAALVMQKYQTPLPGTAVFVMPGTSRLVVQKLLPFLPLGNLGRATVRRIAESLERYFELGERPLQTDLGKRLVPRLTYLSLGENLRVVADHLDADGLRDDDLKELADLANNLRRSENRRRRVKKRAKAEKLQATKRRPSK